MTDVGGDYKRKGVKSEKLTTGDTAPSSAVDYENEGNHRAKRAKTYATEADAANDDTALSTEDVVNAAASEALAAVNAAVMGADDTTIEQGFTQTSTPGRESAASILGSPRKKRNSVDSTSSAPRTTATPSAPLLSSAGIPLDPLNIQHFDNFLFHLILYKAEHNNFHVAKEEHPSLYMWLQTLKRMYKNYAADAANGFPDTSDNDNDSNERDKTAKQKLTVAQVKVLEYLHVPLTSRGDDHWNRFFLQLINYKERHGHVLVPRLCEVPGLGDWVTDQRRQYKQWKQGGPSQLTNDRRAKLSALGFAWQVRNRPEWDIRFNELLEYKAKFGDCKVPQHYKENRALGKWVAKQREQFKLLKKGQHSFLTPYRKEKLDKVGFVWQVRTALDTDLSESGNISASRGKEEAAATVPPVTIPETVGGESVPAEKRKEPETTDAAASAVAATIAAAAEAATIAATAPGEATGAEEVVSQVHVTDLDNALTQSHELPFRSESV